MFTRLPVSLPRILMLMVALSCSLAARAEPTTEEQGGPPAPSTGKPQATAPSTSEARSSADVPSNAPPVAPSLVEPKLIDDPGVSYPQSALDAGFYETVEITLVLELDQDGRVLNSTVAGEPPAAFASEALRAAGLLRFAPARRDEQAIPARIKFRYLFLPPPPTLVGRVQNADTGAPLSEARVVVRTAEGIIEVATAADGAWALDEVPTGVAEVEVNAAAHEPQRTRLTLRPGEEVQVIFRLVSETEDDLGKDPTIDVLVRGQAPEPAVSSYSRQEVRKIPGAFGDPFRAVETLPGVTPVASGLPFFYVRGAPPGNVGYFLDGVRVPYLYHLGFGPSVVQPALVASVDLYPGGYPARLGRFAGGVVEANTTQPRADLHGEGNLRLFDVGGLVETGFADGRGTALLGGRYSYTAAILSLAAPDITLDYRDYQARLSYDVTDGDRISVFSFGSYDLLGQSTNDVEQILFGTEFYRVDLRYDRRLEGGNLRTAVTLGYDRTHAAELQNNVVDRSVAVRAELSKHLGERVQLRSGTSLAFDAFHVEDSPFSDPDNPEIQGFREQFRPRTDLASGLWADARLGLTRKLELTPGLRLDFYRSGTTEALAFEPRVSARWSPIPEFRMIPAFGIAHQAPSFALPVSGLAPSLNEGLQRSTQGSLGVELDLPADATSGATLFYSQFTNMTDAVGTATGGGPPDFTQRSDGRSYGIEAFVRRRLTQRLGGFLSYTLSRSERTIGTDEFPSAFDRTHVVNTALSYELGRGWSTGGRFVFYSGVPEQEAAATVAGIRSDEVDRGPPFFRLDLRVEKRWLLSDATWISFVSEVMNATLNKETFGGDQVGPIVIPSIGAEIGF